MIIRRFWQLILFRKKSHTLNFFFYIFLWPLSAPWGPIKGTFKSDHLVLMYKHQQPWLFLSCSFKWIHSQFSFFFYRYANIPSLCCVLLFPILSLFISVSTCKHMHPEHITVLVITKNNWLLDARVRWRCPVESWFQAQFCTLSGGVVTFYGVKYFSQIHILVFGSQTAEVDQGEILLLIGRLMLGAMWTSRQLTPLLHKPAAALDK